MIRIRIRTCGVLSNHSRTWLRRAESPRPSFSLEKGASSTNERRVTVLLPYYTSGEAVQNVLKICTARCACGAWRIQLVLHGNKAIMHGSSQPFFFFLFPPP